MAGVVALVLIVASGVVGYSAGKRKNAISDPVGDAYPLLAKRTLVNNPNDPLINFTPLRKQLNDYIDKNAIHGSMYFEYLPTGTAVRIADDRLQEVASLLKVPAAMELFKAAELGKVQIDTPIALKQQWLSDDFGTLYQKGAGYQLTPREATRTMLQQSDSTALNVVRASIGDRLSSENAVLNAVDIDYAQGEDMTLSLSARSYSSLLKCLYFSCYVNHKDSQTILEYLTQTPFNARIVAGIPDKTIKVAHKVGVIGDTNQADCGIIYLRNRNYILCMVVNGPDDTYVDKYMADMSNMVYRYVTK